MYHDDDQPTRAERKMMWRNIEKGIAPARAPIFFIHDLRSFAYGLAAAFVIYFAAFGAWQAVKQQMESDLPAEIKVDIAYRSAIDALEGVIPVTQPNQQNTPQGTGILTARQEQLQLLDTAIANLRKETGANDVSPIFRARLRQLYTLKLQVLQQMIEHGEIEL